MARVTVEDCVEKLPNRFELVMLASQRARKIGAGAALTIDRDNDKNTVVSLREIAEDTVSVDNLREELIRSHQRVVVNDEDDKVSVDLMEGEEEWNTLVAGGDAGGDTYGKGYSEEDYDSEKELTLEDIAGGAPSEDDEDDRY